MLEALLIIILLPVAIGVIAMVGGTILGGLSEIIDPPKDPWAGPAKVIPLKPPSFEFWVGAGAIVGGLAFSILLYHIAG